MSTINSFDFEEGKILSNKYQVVNRLGKGWEGEVYLVKEIDTGIERAAKFFYPSRNLKNKTIRMYAKKLHKLRHCNSLVKYITRETLRYKSNTVSYVLSDFVEGESLETYLKDNYPKGMHFYQALHLFYAIVIAVEEIHLQKKYHGDLHTENIILQYSGLNYELKLIDVFHIGSYQYGSMQDDIYNLCQILYEIVGGKKRYKFQPEIVKKTCFGQKKTLIRKNFRNATQLRIHLENSIWE
jgi:tRNA A-37 threonylcarbamoyl transferase component Bud32